MLDKMFKEPEQRLHTLRILIYGLPKQGKTHFATTATEVGPLYVFDTEKGFDFYDKDAGHGFKTAETDDPRKILTAVQSAKVGKDGTIPIICVDSSTSVWEAQKEVAEQLTAKWKNVSDPDRAVFRAWAPAKKPLKSLYRTMHQAQCHIIFTARAKKEYEVSAGGEPTFKGLVPDVESNLEYAVDLVLLAGMDEVAQGKPPKPTNFWVKVMGGRSKVQIGTIVRDPTFQKVLELAVPEKLLSGKPPTEVEDSSGDQVEEEEGNFQTWKEMQLAIEQKGWSVEEVKAELGKEFGKFNPARMSEYWKWLKSKHG